jgi:8-oxo-dGTP pyrophosphatase MutT (NUDIX family)
MIVALQRVWDSFLGPLLQRPKKLQVAALCHRGEGADSEYLLITSRDTGRWIIPKGWPIRGLKSNETALREAWEEAGVKNSQASNTPVGRYTYNKRAASGLEVPVETLVYSVEVQDLAKKFPEAHERTLKWVKAGEAANMVQEPELQSIFRTCAARSA